MEDYREEFEKVNREFEEVVINIHRFENFKHPDLDIWYKKAYKIIDKEMSNRDISGRYRFYSEIYYIMKKYTTGMEFNARMGRIRKAVVKYL